LKDSEKVLAETASPVFQLPGRQNGQSQTGYHDHSLGTLLGCVEDEIADPHAGMVLVPAGSNWLQHLFPLLHWTWKPQSYAEMSGHGRHLNASWSDWKGMLDFDHSRSLLLSLYHDQLPDPSLLLWNSGDAAVYYEVLLGSVNSVAVTMDYMPLKSSWRNVQALVVCSYCSSIPDFQALLC